MDQKSLKSLGHVERISDDRLTGILHALDLDGRGVAGRLCYGYLCGVEKAGNSRTLELMNGKRRCMDLNRVERFLNGVNSGMSE